MTAILLLAFLAQNFDQRGFIENRTLVYPQDASNDTANVVDQVLLRWEAYYKFSPWLKLNASLDARADTHRQTDRDASFDVDDRTIRRPAISLRQLSATIHRGKVTIELGRQLIRWGKTDILTPTDRFAPKDYLSSVVDSDYLGVIAGRATLSGVKDSLDVIWQPWFTPSRIPLLNQRWSGLDGSSASIVDAGARYPGGSQFGARWNHVTAGHEFSLSYFDGFNSLPSFEAVLDPSTLTVRALRTYPKLTMYGADGAVQFPWVTVKAEAGYFTTTTPGEQEYVLYVVQLERQVKEWSFVGGYAGEVVTNRGNSPLQFAPDRGFAKSVVGRAAWTIDVNRSLTLETAVRKAGSFLRFEYSQTFGQHWRVTPGVAWIRGDMTDFLGQYRRNSYLSLALRYSF